MATETRPTTSGRRTPGIMRVLVAFGDVRSLYSRTIARAIRELRSGLEVRSSGLGELERELEGFEPHVVVVREQEGEGLAEGRVVLHDHGVYLMRIASVCLPPFVAATRRG